MHRLARTDPGPLIDPLARRTGGWRWHGRALRSAALWAPTRSAIAHWLATVPHPLPSRLVWVGASAGWMMPAQWLLDFQQIEIVDLDPLCAPLLAARHGWRLARASVRWQVHRLDAIDRLDELLKRWPDAVLLFDNVLGQQRYRYSDGDALERWLDALHVRLAGRLWGSVHDWLSGPFDSRRYDASAANLPFEMVTRLGGRAPILLGPDCGGTADSSVADTLLNHVGARGDWQDHLTGRIFPTGIRGVLIPWRFSATHLHWLQAAWVDGR